MINWSKVNFNFMRIFSWLGLRSLGIDLLAYNDDSDPGLLSRTSHRNQTSHLSRLHTALLTFSFLYLILAGDVVWLSNCSSVWRHVSPLSLLSLSPPPPPRDLRLHCGGCQQVNEQINTAAFYHEKE